MPNIEKLHEYQKENAAFLLQTALETIEEMFYKNEPLSVRKLADRSGVSTSFISTHKEIMEKLDYYKSIPSNEVTLERINLVMKENKKLEEKILFYTNLLINQQF